MAAVSTRGQLVWKEVVAFHTSHVCKFFASSFKVISVFLLNGILNGTWNRIVDAQDRALNKLDFPCSETLQPSLPWLLLSLPPRFSRTRVTSGVRRRGSVDTESGRWVFNCRASILIWIIVDGLGVGAVALC